MTNNHYKQGDIECLDYLRDVLSPEEYQGFLRGSIIKYNHRMMHKGQELSDAEKLKHYGCLLIEHLQRQRVQEHPASPRTAEEEAPISPPARPNREGNFGRPFIVGDLVMVQDPHTKETVSCSNCQHRLWKLVSYNLQVWNARCAVCVDPDTTEYTGDMLTQLESACFILSSISTEELMNRRFSFFNSTHGVNPNLEYQGLGRKPDQQRENHDKNNEYR